MNQHEEIKKNKSKGFKEYSIGVKIGDSRGEIHKDMWYKCEGCNYSNSRKCSVKRHIIRKHKRENFVGLP